MRILLTCISFFLFKVSFSQSYVYKRNIFTNDLEVFKSQGGFPTGLPLMKVRKNLWGYLEVEEIETTTNPYSKKPDYSAYTRGNSYQLPTKEIFETLEVLNKRYEYDKVSADPNRTSNNSAVDLVNANTQNRTTVANAFLKFYNSNVDFPKTLKDGWYDVVKIFDSEGSSLFGTIGGTDFKYGICNVKQNKIVDYYENCNAFDLKSGFVFQRAAINVISTINSCKTTFKLKNGNQYQTLYFLDNILEPTKQIEKPEFFFYSIYTSTSILPKDAFLVQISRNVPITREKVEKLEVGPYSATLSGPNPNNFDCTNSLLTLAFKKSNDVFSIGIMGMSKNSIWVVNDLSFTQETCKSINLSY